MVRDSLLATGERAARAGSRSPKPPYTLPRYHPTVSRNPSSKLTSGCHPSSCRSLRVYSA